MTRASGPSGRQVQIAQVYAWRKELDLAFEWLDRAYERHDAGLIRMGYDRPLASLRTDPRFLVLAHKIGVPE